MDGMERNTCLFCGEMRDASREQRSFIAELVQTTLSSLCCDVTIADPSDPEKLDRLADSTDLCVLDVTGDDPLVWYVYGRRRALEKPVVLLCEKDAASRCAALMDEMVLPYSTDAGEQRDLRKRLAERAAYILTRSGGPEEAEHGALFDEIDRVLEERLACLVSLDDDIRTQLDSWRQQTVSQLHEAARMADTAPPAGQTLQQWFDRRMDEAVAQMRSERTRYVDDAHLRELFDQYLDKSIARMRGSTADPTVRAGETLQQWFDKRLDQVVSQLADMLEGREMGERDRK